MATNPLQLQVQGAPNKHKRLVTCKSKSTSFKRVVFIYSNVVQYFSGSGIDKPMTLDTKEASLALAESGLAAIPVIILFLGSDSFVHGIPIDPFQLLIVQEPVFHNMKMTHVVDVSCLHPKTNKLECVLSIEIPMT